MTGHSRNHRRTHCTCSGLSSNTDGLRHQYTTISGQIDLTSGRISAAHRQFSRIRQLAPLCTLSSTRILGPTRVHVPNGSSISSAVFSGLTIVTNRPTDHAIPSVTTGRIYMYVVLRCSIIIHNNNEKRSYCRAQLLHNFTRQLATDELRLSAPVEILSTAAQLTKNYI